MYRSESTATGLRQEGADTTGIQAACISSTMVPYGAIAWCTESIVALGRGLFTALADLTALHSLERDRAISLGPTGSQLDGSFWSRVNSLLVQRSACGACERGHFLPRSLKHDCVLVCSFIILFINTHTHGASSFVVGAPRAGRQNSFLPLPALCGALSAFVSRPWSPSLQGLHHAHECYEACHVDEFRSSVAYLHWLPDGIQKSMRTVPTVYKTLPFLPCLPNPCLPCLP